MPRHAPAGLRVESPRAVALVALALLLASTAGSPPPTPASRAREVCGMNEEVMRQEIAAWYSAHPAHGASPAAATPADTFLTSSFRFNADGNTATQIDTSRVLAGQSVMFKWVSGFHTATSGQPGDLDAGSLFDLPVDGTSPQNAEQIVVFDTPGTFPFFCQPHGSLLNMKGVVVVSPNPAGAPGADAPRASGLVGAPWPNPTRDGATFRFALTRPGRVSADVLDANGRRVASLFDREWSAGSWTAAWDGRARGGRAAPGVYFVRLRTADGASTRRLTVIE